MVLNILRLASSCAIVHMLRNRLQIRLLERLGQKSDGHY